MAEQVAAPIFDVTVNFLILPENYVLKEVFASNTPVAEIRAAMANKLKIEAACIDFRLHGEPLSDAETLEAYNVNLDAEIQIDMTISYARATPTIQAYRLPDRLQVHVTDVDGSNPRLINIDIERADEKQPKAFLGGYRHKKTGIVYHHASVQTIAQRKPPPTVVKFEREVQTTTVITRSQQTVREAGTQMSRKDLFVESSGDKTIVSKPYQTADEFHVIKVQKTIIIQCAVRCWIARKRVNALRQAKYERQLNDMQKLNEAQHLAEENNRKEIQRRMHPRSAQDFEILYKELEAWRLHETEVIKSNTTLTPHETQGRLRELLHKETKLLQTIDRLKIAAAKENRELRIKNHLTAMAAPKTWSLHTGETAVVHTPFTTRAQELAQLYNGLRLPMLSMEERLDVLLHVKWTVKEFDCNLTREIVELIDREIDMLKRGRNEKSLDGLRKRMANLFLQFVETPEFNPEASRFKKVPVSGAPSSPTFGSTMNASTTFQSGNFTSSRSSSRLA